MKVINPDSRKEIEVKDMRITMFDIPNQHGEMISTKCVELTIVGDNTEWPNWFLYKKFKQLNPNIDV